MKYGGVARSFVFFLSGVLIACGDDDGASGSSSSTGASTTTSTTTSSTDAASGSQATSASQGSGGGDASSSDASSGGVGGGGFGGTGGEGASVGTGASTGTGGAGSGGAGDFENEPPGFVVIGEWNDAAALDAGGWYDDGNPTAWGEKRRVEGGYAGTPRWGGGAAIETFYAGGVDGGHDAGRMQLDLPPGLDELYFAAEVQFAADYPTSTSSGGNKQLFVTFSGGGRYFVNLDDGMAAGKWGVYEGSAPLADSTADVVYGEWVGVEWYLRRDTGAADGVMRLWIDGALALELTSLTFPEGDMVLAYDDGSNNGNHYPGEADPRRIGTPLGGPVDAYRWAALLRVSAPQP